MTNLIACGQGLYQANERELIVTDGKAATARHCVIALPGHGNNGWGYLPPALGFDFARLFANLGIAFMAIDAGGIATWGGPPAQTAIANAVTRALALFGGAKVGILGYSMGGLGALNYVKRNPANVAGTYLIDPVTDLEWVHKTAGYVPGYDTAPAAAVNAGWPGEAETAYGTNAAGWAAAAAGWSPQAFAGNLASIPLRIAHATDDTTVPANASAALIAAIGSKSAVLRPPPLTGDHTGVWANLPPGDVVGFFASLGWS